MDHDTPRFRRALVTRSVGVAMAGMLVLGLAGYLPNKAKAVTDLGDVKTAAVATTCGVEGATGKVLMLAATATYRGCSHQNITSAAALGFATDLATDEEWAAMTAADFASYRAIVLGDAVCGGGTELVDAAEANASTWSPVITGNVLVIGTDEALHTGGRGEVLTEKGMAFITADAAKPGAYISLGCMYHYYEPADTPTPVDVLAGFGTFKALRTGAISEDDCYNDIHIVATHPALAGMTDANLENWGCSVHEVLSEWPLDFEVLTIAENIGTEFFTAPDGTQGAPYILARGVTVISDITLSPESATNPVGTTHTVIAHVSQDGAPVAGTSVTFTVVGGPHTGTTGSSDTDADGNASFTYTGTTEGTDTIEATFVDSRERTQRSNRVTKTWEARAVEDCTNGVDDDGDGLDDIDDPDCPAGTEGPPGAPNCSDKRDNDRDGLVDAADPDCQAPAIDPCEHDGLLEEKTLGQHIWDDYGPLGGLIQDPGQDFGPISKPVEDLRPDVATIPGIGPLVETGVHEGACAMNTPFLDL